MTTRPDELQSDDAGIEDLLREVGPRDEPSPEMERELYAAVHAEWRALVEQRQRKRRIVTWGMAASFALVVLVGALSLKLSVAPTQPVAMVALVDGVLTTDPKGAAPAAARKAGDPVSTGERVSTDGASRAALTVGNGLSLRLDHDTVVRFVSNDTVMLEAGTVYVDDPPAAMRTPLTIESRAGSITHVGTQYAVRHMTSGIEVSVREGRVLLTNSAGTSAGVAGDQLRVTDAGQVTRDRIAPDDERWAWVRDAAPKFDINDRSLAVFLAWIARETGRELVYETPFAKAAADEAMLHGSIDGLALDTALTTVLSTTQLRQYSAGEHRIGIRLASSTARGPQN